MRNGYDDPKGGPIYKEIVGEIIQWNSLLRTPFLNQVFIKV